MKTYRPVFVIALIATTIAAGLQLSSAMAASQASQPGATSAEATVLEAFAKILPIDAHLHIYKADPEFATLFERLNLRAINICVIDDRDPDYNSIEPQRTQVLDLRRLAHGRAASPPRSVRMDSSSRGLLTAPSAN